MTIAWAWLGAARDASAQARRAVPVMLSWRVVEGCPDRDAAAARIAQLLGRPAETPAARPFGARVAITRDIHGELQLRVETMTVSDSGERYLQGHDCGDLVEAAAVMIALALEPEARGLPPSAGAVVPRGRAPVPRAGVAARGHVRLVGTADVGVLPRPSVGAGVVFGAVFGRLQLELEGGVGLPQSVRAADVDVRAEVQALVAGGLRGCLGFGTRVWGVGPCVAVHAATLRAQATGAVMASTPSEAAWVGTALGGAFDWSITNVFALRTTLEAGVAWLRPAFVVQGCCAFEAASPVYVRLSVGPELRFP